MGKKNLDDASLRRIRRRKSLQPLPGLDSRRTKIPTRFSASVGVSLRLDSSMRLLAQNLGERTQQAGTMFRPVGIVVASVREKLTSFRLA